LRFISGAVPYTPLPITSILLNPLLPYQTVPQLEQQAAGFAADGAIDSLNNLNGSKIFVYSGTTDIIVNNGTADNIILLNYTNIPGFRLIHLFSYVVHGYRVAQFFSNLSADVATDLEHTANHVMVRLLDQRFLTFLLILHYMAMTPYALSHDRSFSDVIEISIIQGLRLES